MQMVNIHEAKTHLSRLIEGEPFIIAKAGKPLAQVMPYQKPKRIGFMSLSVPDDFDNFAGEEIQALFIGEMAEK